MKIKIISTNEDLDVDKSNLLFEHYFICGDSTKVKLNDYMLKNNVVCFTSPPYNAGSNALGGNKNKVDSKYEDYNDNKTQNEWLDLVYNSIKNIQLYSLYQIYNIQQLAGNKVAFIDLFYKMRNNFVDRLVWYKGEGCPAMAENVLNSRFEDIFIFATEDSPNRAIKSGKFRGTVSNVINLTSSKDKDYSKFHAATFPISLVDYIITNFTKENDTVIDNFSGTGTTAVSALKNNRNSINIELDPKYLEISIQRLERLLNKKRVLL